MSITPELKAHIDFLLKNPHFTRKYHLVFAKAMTALWVNTMGIANTVDKHMSAGVYHLPLDQGSAEVKKQIADSWLLYHAIPSLSAPPEVLWPLWLGSETYLLRIRGLMLLQDTKHWVIDFPTAQLSEMLKRRYCDLLFSDAYGHSIDDIIREEKAAKKSLYYTDNNFIVLLNREDVGFGIPARMTLIQMPGANAKQQHIEVTRFESDKAFCDYLVQAVVNEPDYDQRAYHTVLKNALVQFGWRV